MKTLLSNKRMRIPDAIFKNVLIPMISYFELDTFFDMLGLDDKQKAEIKAIEYKRRLVIQENSYSAVKVEYYLENRLHREGGPAMIWETGTLEWWYNYKRHREDGPAITKTNGYKEWWVNGKRHNSNGPAIQWQDKYKEWWVNGECIREEK